MNRSIESFLRFVHLTSSGLLAGSLAFGGSALFPGWEEELPVERKLEAERTLKAFNAIGPTALATAVTLLVGTRRGAGRRRILDAASAASLAGVLGATLLGTVPINRKISLERPPDYPSDESLSTAKNWARVHALRTALGVTAFVIAAGATVLAKRE
ncbi:MAG: anthrone oxygenase family protein [Thermoanaerobaculia bacterium]